MTFGDKWSATRANVVGNYKIGGKNDMNDHLVHLFFKAAKDMTSTWRTTTTSRTEPSPLRTKGWSSLKTRGTSSSKHPWRAGDPYFLAAAGL